MVKVIVKASRFLNFGKQPSGKLLFFRKGEEKEVELTEQIINAIENGLLIEVEKPKKKKSKKKEE